MAVTLAASEASRVGNLMLAVVECVGERYGWEECERVLTVSVCRTCVCKIWYVTERLRAQSMEMLEKDTMVGGGPHLLSSNSSALQECLSSQLQIRRKAERGRDYLLAPACSDFYNIVSA
jgi:hypothetical protein